MWLKIAVILVVIAINVAGALFYGSWRWQRSTQDVRKQLLAARQPVVPVFSRHSSPSYPQGFSKV